MSEYHRPVSPEPVANIYYPDGELYDHLLTWETVQTYANDLGMSDYPIIVVSDDGRMTREDIAAMAKRERELIKDCYGLDSVGTVSIGEEN